MSTRKKSQKECRTPPREIAKEDVPFWKFFCSILSHGRLTQAYQDHLLSRYMKNFKCSITHLSMTNNIVTSLEYYERIGDTVVNMCVNWWLVAKFPKMIDIDFTTTLLSAFKGTKYLGKIALEKGWGKIMKIDPSVFDRLDFLARQTKTFTATKERPEGDYRTMSDYYKIYEDGLEAFFGCLVKTMEDDGQSFGAALQVAYTIFFWLADTTYFNGPTEEPGMEHVINDVDPVTTLRNLYQNNDELGWTMEGAMKNDEIEAHLEGGKPIPKKYRATVYHWDGVRNQRKFIIDSTGKKIYIGNAKQYYNTSNREILFVGDWTFDSGQGKAVAAKKALELLADGIYYKYDSQGKLLDDIGHLSKKYTMKHPVDPTDPHKKWTGVYYTHSLAKELEQGARGDRDARGDRGDRGDRDREGNRGRTGQNQGGWKKQNNWQNKKTKTLTIGK